MSSLEKPRISKKIWTSTWAARMSRQCIRTPSRPLVRFGLSMSGSTNSTFSRRTWIIPARSVDLLIKIMQNQGRFKIYASLPIPSEIDHMEKAREDARTILIEYSSLSEEAAAIISSELWGTIRDCLRSMSDLIDQFDRGELNSKDDILSFTAISVKTALMIRSFIGADKLSYESVALFATKKDLERITKMDANSSVEMTSNRAPAN